MIGIIYKYTSPSGKIYIGQTIDENRRRREFLSSSNYSGVKINNARKKYGPENFTYEVIEKIENEDIDILLTTLYNEEEKYIKIFDSYNNGYNSSPGRTLEAGICKESLIKMSNSLKEYYKIHNGTFLGKKHSDSTKLIISEKQKNIMERMSTVIKVNTYLINKDGIYLNIQKLE